MHPLEKEKISKENNLLVLETLVKAGTLKLIKKEVLANLTKEQTLKNLIKLKNS